MTVRTRFAPSPTGYMHIGGMRTALFNWLWARRNNGQFILRIDDTDQQRNRDEALEPILEAFRWLGLDWDEGPAVGGDCGPYFQSQRQELYDAARDKLLASGQAYRDFEPAEATRRQREAAEKENRQYTSSRVSLELSADDVKSKVDSGEPHVIRFLVPRDRTVAIRDHVRGDVEWSCSLMVDPVIVRGDGSPLYNFATVVDDAHMRISHVIRAEEHLSNTPVQVLLHEALGNELPEFAHIAFVAAPASKKKLSKRDIGKYQQQKEFRKLFELGRRVLDRIGKDSGDDGLSPVMVAFYREVGFLPAGVLNALVRLGWSLDDETENISLDEARSAFHLDRVVKSSAGFDPDKLMSYQTHWMAQLTDEQRCEGCLPFLTQAGLLGENPDEADRERVLGVVRLAGDRLRVFGEILDLDEFFSADDDFAIDDRNFQKRVVVPDQALDLIRAFRGRLANCEPFDQAAIHRQLSEFVEEREIRFGEIAPAVRLCTTGKTQGADLAGTLALIGRESCLARIDRATGLADSLRVG